MMVTLGCLIVCIVFIIVGCSTPVMKLDHDLKVEASYTQMGTISVISFEDKRSTKEKNEDMVAMNTLTPRLISGVTNPSIAQYLHNALREEIETTKIFSFAKPAQYQLYGEIKSMKVERSVNLFRYVTFGLLDFPELMATVNYHAVLRKDGQIIFEEDIEQLEKEKYWAWSNFTITSWKRISNRGGHLLDRCVSNSIRKMFNEIQSQCELRWK